MYIYIYLHICAYLYMNVCIMCIIRLYTYPFSAFPQRLRGLWHRPFRTRSFGGLPRGLWASGTGRTHELLESIHFGGGDLHGRTILDVKSTGT